MPIIITRPEITATYLVVDENGTVLSSHPQKVQTELTADGFIEALNVLLDARDNLDLSDNEVQMLMRTGNILSLGNVQATTLGVTSQYQFPTTAGRQGQVLAYQGTSQLEWIGLQAGGGAQGAQGFQGRQGNQGAQGAPGGGQGLQASQGAQGRQGNQGNQGAQGNQGFQGAPGGGQGLQASQGAQGFQGRQGNQGNQGNQGAQGNQGFQGAPGGGQGLQASQGAQGFQGRQGSQGNQGFQGAPGSGGQGLQASQGPQGYQGHQGYRGYQGVTNSEILLALTGDGTSITTGTNKLTFRMPYAMILDEVRANVVTAPVGSSIIVDINQNGSTILSTKLSIDATEKTSLTASSAAVISTDDLTDDAEITIDIDQVGSSTAGTGLKVLLKGTKTVEGYQV